MKHALKSLSFVLLLAAVLLSVSVTPSFADNDEGYAASFDGVFLSKFEEL